MLVIRSATVADAAAIREIYAPIVNETVISFELEPPSVAEMHRRMSAILAVLPWLVSEDNGMMCGYAYASPHRERAAYRWSVDVSVYVHEQWRGKGVGHALYTALFAALRALGYFNVYAGIALPNAASVALHEAMGMESIGVFRHAGYKLGGWHDVGWWQGMLQQLHERPELPRVIGDIYGTPEWDTILSHGISSHTKR